jgi:hypothetical protein
MVPMRRQADGNRRLSAERRVEKVSHDLRSHAVQFQFLGRSDRRASRHGQRARCGEARIRIRGDERAREAAPNSRATQETSNRFLHYSIFKDPARGRQEFRLPATYFRPTPGALGYQQHTSGSRPELTCRQAARSISVQKPLSTPRKSPKMTPSYGHGPVWKCLTSVFCENSTVEDRGGASFCKAGEK